MCAEALLRRDGRVASGHPEQAEGNGDSAKEARSNRLAGEAEADRAGGGGEGDAQVHLSVGGHPEGGAPSALRSQIGAGREGQRYHQHAEQEGDDHRGRSEVEREGREHQERADESLDCGVDMYWHNSCDRDHGLRVPPRTCVLCEVNHSGFLFSGGTRRPAADTFKPMASARKRLDMVLVDRGLFETRSKAAAAVVAGDVLIGEERRRAEKPGLAVDPAVGLDVREPPRFVSRGGLKLDRALDAFGLDVAGRGCLDAGASTGGFTDCLVQRGAAHVVALDVAYGQLHWSLRQDPRVTVLERRNVRALGADELPYRPGLIVADLSFIGLGKALPALAACA